MSTTEIDTPKKPRGLKDLINSESMREQFAKALPQHLTADRFIRVATTALSRTPGLLDCTPESFMKCLLDLSSYGLEPDGRRAHLIPFKNHRKNITECTLIIDWKGLAELVLRSGMITKLHADLVCENDEFEFNLGEVVKHRINFREPRGEKYAVYAMATTKDGATFVAVMSGEEVLSIRDGSQAWKAFIKYGNSCPWDPANPSSEGEMWKKTAFRRLTKWLPLSPEIRDAVERDDEEPAGLRNVTPARQQITGGRSAFETFAPPEEAAEPAPVEVPADDAPEFVPAQAIDDIKSVADAAEMTMASFTAKARAAGLLGPDEKLDIKLAPEKLRALCSAAEEVAAGTYGKEGA